VFFVAEVKSLATVELLKTGVNIAAKPVQLPLAEQFQPLANQIVCRLVPARSKLLFDEVPKFGRK